MGKKMGINTKAVEARERKDATKKTKNEAVEKRKADEYWRDDDKHVNRKLDRQKEREQKAQEERERKLANKAAYEREMELAEKSAKAKSLKHQPVEVPKRATQFEIQKTLEEEHKQAAQAKLQDKKINTAPIPLVPNINRLEDVENASTIDQALELFKAHSLEPSIIRPAAAPQAAAAAASSRRK